MHFSYQQHLSIGDILLDSDIRGLEVVRLDTGSFLLSSTGANGGLVSYRLEADGTVSGEIDRQYFSQDNGSSVSGMMDTIAAGNSATILLSGGQATAMVQYGISASGEISSSTSTSSLTGSSALTAASLDSGTVFYSVAQDSGQVVAYVPGSTGNTLLQGGGSEQVILEGVSALETVSIGSQLFLLAAQNGTQSITSYAINTNTGALTYADDLGAAQGLGIQAPTTFEAVTAFGQTWVLLGSAGSGTLSVLALSDTGQMTAVDHSMDTLATRFGGVQSLATAQVDDRVFVVAGGADDGLTLLTLLPDGRLMHLESIAQTIGAGLMNVEEIAITIVGDTLQVFVSSGTDSGISRFSVDLSNLGDTLRGDTNSANTLQGDAGDDLLVAGQGDTVFGGDGDDILLGAAGAFLSGGGGVDRFVLQENGATTRIVDFNPAEDRLDMSSFSMLRSAAQLNITSTSYGALIQLRNTVIEIRSANGLSLDADDLFGPVFDWADRIPIFELTEAEPQPDLEPEPEPSPPDTGGNNPGLSIIGTSNAEVLEGNTDDDILVGSGGNDTLDGAAGNDALYGGIGDDILRGAEGNDTVQGGAGNDQLVGASGSDILRGGDNDDWVTGASGSDSLYGDAGRDTLLGGDDADVVFGGWGNDSIDGGLGSDTLYGDGGDDVIRGGVGHDGVWGDTGNDTLYGDAGADTLGGFTGDDDFYGGDGNDVIWGNVGNDRGWGGWGNDTLGGGDDGDLLFGEGGKDLVWGGADNDTLSGGIGVDTVGGFVGDDILRGNEGDDQVWGNRGQDSLYGDEGNDLLGGGDDNDVLMGGDGDDELRGGEGDDWLSGGSGADTFYFRFNQSGSDRVADFNLDVDIIQIDVSNLEFQSLQMSQQGDNVVIQLQNGDITLNDTDLSDLTADLFLIA